MRNPGISPKELSFEDAVCRARLNGADVEGDIAVDAKPASCLSRSRKSSLAPKLRKPLRRRSSESVQGPFVRSCLLAGRRSRVCECFLAPTRLPSRVRAFSWPAGQSIACKLLCVFPVPRCHKAVGCDTDGKAELWYGFEISRLRLDGELRMRRR